MKSSCSEPALCPRGHLSRKPAFHNWTAALLSAVREAACTEDPAQSKKDSNIHAVDTH